jgi:hypothetical protein
LSSQATIPWLLLLFLLGSLLLLLPLLPSPPPFLDGSLRPSFPGTILALEIGSLLPPHKRKKERPKKLFPNKKQQQQNRNVIFTKN